MGQQLLSSKRKRNASANCKSIGLAKVANLTRIHFLAVPTRNTTPCRPARLALKSKAMNKACATAGPMERCRPSRRCLKASWQASTQYSLFAACNENRERSATGNGMSYAGVVISQRSAGSESDDAWDTGGR